MANPGLELNRAITMLEIHLMLAKTLLRILRIVLPRAQSLSPCYGYLRAYFNIIRRSGFWKPVSATRAHHNLHFFRAA